MIKAGTSLKPFFHVLAGILIILSVAHGDVIINEFMASNDSTLKDEFGDDADWIELHNRGTAEVNLLGWSLTDNEEAPRKWIFPEVILEAGEYLLVYATNRDLRDPGAALHTNFALSAGGEYLGLRRADESIANEFTPEYPVQMTDVSYGYLPGTVEAVYFDPPTPGEANGEGGGIGPVLSGATYHIPRPAGTALSSPEVVSVRVTPTAFDIDTESVLLAYRTMFGAEETIQLRDDGQGADEVAGDDVFSGYLPTSGPAPGEMLRWRFEAADIEGNIGRAPVYSDPDDFDYYYGTVALNPDEGSSSLPIVHQFIQNVSAAERESGTRCSLFFLDRFYDNVFVNLHGGSTASFTKKSHNFDFNADNRFVWSEDAERKVKDVDILTNHADKTRVRNSLSHKVAELAGAVYHFTFPVRVQRNAAFHGVFDMIEDGDDRMTERNGLDPEGALYKMDNNLRNVTAARKKTRKEEDNSDLQELISGLNINRILEGRREFFYDNVNVSATINYLAVRTINNDGDHGHKNYYVYRDTNGTREWEPIIWDVDLSWGHVWTSSRDYFDDALTNIDIESGAWSDNRIYRVVWDSPELRKMYVRRLRTLMDEILEPPGTVDGWVETYMREVVATIDPDPAEPSPWTDGDRDFGKWGSWGGRLPPRAEVERVISEFVPSRRAFLYDQNAETRPLYNEEPIPDEGQTSIPGMVVFDMLEYSPLTGPWDEEFFVLKNTTAEAVDISGWTVSGAMDYTFPSGTVIPSGDGTEASEYVGILHVVKDAFAFRQRALEPTGGQGRYVVGNYDGSLPFQGGTLDLHDRGGVLISSVSYVGETTALQDNLKITEIQYNPAALTAEEEAAFPDLGKEDFEYIELVNVGSESLDLEGAYFSDGIDFVFPALILEVGEAIVLAKNPSAVMWRYSIEARVFGPYDGQLSNSGEQIALSDINDIVILDFEYSDDWYLSADGKGRSLVLRDPATAYDEFGEPTAWAVSIAGQGDPGSFESEFASEYSGWRYPFFSGDELNNQLVSGINADPDLDGRPNWLEYAFGCNPLVPDDVITATYAAEDKAGLRMQRPHNPIDIEYVLQASPDVGSAGEWITVPFQIEKEVNGVQLEHVIFVDSGWKTAEVRFYRLLVKRVSEL